MKKQPASSPRSKSPKKRTAPKKKYRVRNWSKYNDALVAPSLMGSERNAVALVGDGAYDDWFIYALCEGNGIPDVRIPPKKGAVIWRHGNTAGAKETRDENLRAIRKKGKKKWKEESGYHIRSNVENFFFRLKTIFGDRLSARTAGRQRTEAALMCAALNRMMALGMPESYAVQAAHP